MTIPEEQPTSTYTNVNLGQLPISVWPTVEELSSGRNYISQDNIGTKDNPISLRKVDTIPTPFSIRRQEGGKYTMECRSLVRPDGLTDQEYTFSVTDARGENLFKFNSHAASGIGKHLTSIDLELSTSGMEELFGSVRKLYLSSGSSGILTLNMPGLTIKLDDLHRALLARQIERFLPQKLGFLRKYLITDDFQISQYQNGLKSPGYAPEQFFSTFHDILYARKPDREEKAKQIFDHLKESGYRGLFLRHMDPLPSAISQPVLELPQPDISSTGKTGSRDRLITFMDRQISATSLPVLVDEIPNHSKLPVIVEPEGDYDTATLIENSIIKGIKREATIGIIDTGMSPFITETLELKNKAEKLRKIAGKVFGGKSIYLGKRRISDAMVTGGGWGIPTKSSGANIYGCELGYRGLEQDLFIDTYNLVNEETSETIALTTRKKGKSTESIIALDIPKGNTENIIDVVIPQGVIGRDDYGKIPRVRLKFRGDDYSEPNEIEFLNCEEFPDMLDRLVDLLGLDISHGRIQADDLWGKITGDQGIFARALIDPETFASNIETPITIDRYQTITNTWALSGDDKTKFQLLLPEELLDESEWQYGFNNKGYLCLYFRTDQGLVSITPILNSGNISAGHFNINISTNNDRKFTLGVDFNQNPYLGSTQVTNAIHLCYGDIQPPSHIPSIAFSLNNELSQVVGCYVEDSLFDNPSTNHLLGIYNLKKKHFVTPPRANFGYDNPRYLTGKRVHKLTPASLFAAPEKLFQLAA